MNKQDFSRGQKMKLQKKGLPDFWGIFVERPWFFTAFFIKNFHGNRNEKREEKR